MLKKIISNNSGFSLAETMITASIVTAVSLISVNQYDQIMATARDANRLQNLKQVQTAAILYDFDHEQYPSCDESGKATVECYEVLSMVLQEKKYMPEVPRDPLNSDQYTYKYWSDGKTAKIEFETEDPNDASPRVVWALGS